MSQPVAFITGGAAGIGSATATELANRGYAVALLDSDAARLATAAAELKAVGAQTLAYHGDVGDLTFAESALPGLRVLSQSGAPAAGAGALEGELRWPVVLRTRRSARGDVCDNREQVAKVLGSAPRRDG